MGNSLSKKMLPLFFLFITVASLTLYFQDWCSAKGIDPKVVFTANALLYILSTYTLIMHTRSIDKKNPNAALRGVMVATLMKLLILGSAAIIYIALSKHRSIYAVFVSMGLYFVYTFLEVRIASAKQE
ncbi:MAG: hypothetical protein J0I09_12230 [Sphingobacteriia bacterium]|nr:hypothetical protein [Sphingobacteriia bacterium]